MVNTAKQAWSHHIARTNTLVVAIGNDEKTSSERVRG